MSIGDAVEAAKLDLARKFYDDKGNGFNADASNIMALAETYKAVLIRNDMWVKSDQMFYKKLKKKYCK